MCGDGKEAYRDGKDRYKPLKIVSIDDYDRRMRLAAMTQKYRVQCFFKPYGVSDDVFTDVERMKAFVFERLENASRIQIDKIHKRGEP